MTLFLETVIVHSRNRVNNFLEKYSMSKKFVSSISEAAEYLGWSPGKFGGYFYSGRTPPHSFTESMKPMWDKDVLKKWVKTVRRKNARAIPPSN